MKRGMNVLRILVLLIIAASLSGCFYYNLAKYGMTGEELKKEKEEESRLYGRVLANPNLETCEEYVKRFPFDSGPHKEHVLTIMEPLLFDDVMKKDTEGDYIRYLRWYPKGYRSGDVRERLDPMLFKRVSEVDSYYSYQIYLRWLPDGAYARKVKERITWLRAHKAVVVIDYPRVVERDSSGKWSWDVVFKETGNMIGYKVGGDGYIMDRWGRGWGPYGYEFVMKEFEVPAGGSWKYEDWFSSHDHTFCNGFHVLNVTVYDYGGHSSEFQIRVQLRHTGCPGPTKGN